MRIAERKKAKMSVNLEFIRINSWLIWKNKANLQKAEMVVYIYMKRGYEDFCDFERRKNKANSKPNKANLPAFGRKL